MKIVKIFILLALAVMIFGIPLSPVRAEDWPMFHHDLALSGHTTARAPGSGNVLWTYQTGAAVESSPAVVGDRVYIGSRDGKFYCLDKMTGSPVWPPYDTGSPVQSSPAVAAGIVYFLAENGTVYALKADAGTLVWSRNIGNGGWDWSSPAVHDGKVFVASSTGMLYGLDAEDGTVAWMTMVGGTPDSPIAVRNGKVYTGTHNFNNTSATLVAVDEATGSILWSYDYYLYHSDVVGMVNSNGAAIADGNGDGQLEVYFGVYNWAGSDDQAVCLNEASGAEVWTQNIGGNSTSTPAVHDGAIFIGSDDRNLYAIDAADGSVRWTSPTGGAIYSAPAVSGDGKVCFGSLDHTVYCVDESTGAPVWSYFTGTSRLRSSPAITDCMLFIGNENGKVYAFGTSLSVGIDIKPGSYPNSINTRNNGVITVAILTTDTFDARTVDLSSVCFGDAEDPSQRACAEVHGQAHIEDVDGDWDKDVVLHFKTANTGIDVGDTTACLSGKTTSCEFIQGCDSVRVIR